VLVVVLTAVVAALGLTVVLSVMGDVHEQRDKRPRRKFGRVLQEVRLARGISQEELALESGYYRTYISLLERGRNVPSLRTIFRLASVLQIAPSELVHRVEVQMKE
jgi:DNA-binding XRE family transcriptional regulator